MEGKVQLLHLSLFILFVILLVMTIKHSAKRREKVSRSLLVNVPIITNRGYSDISVIKRSSDISVIKRY